MYRLRVTKQAERLQAVSSGMQELQEDFYQILGVDEKAGADDIRKSYLKLAKKLHPDRFPNDPERKAAAQQEFAKVTRAHEVLADPKQREEYDALRMLARQRAALDMGTGGGPAVTAAQAAAVQQGGADQAKGGGGDNKEQWAAKHSQRAKEYSARKKYQEAETAIKEAIRLDAGRTEYRLQLAEIYLARGWKTLAMTEVQTALRLSPNDPDAKTMEMKLKAAQKAAAGKQAEEKKGGGFMDQLNKLLGKK